MTVHTARRDPARVLHRPAGARAAAVLAITVLAVAVLAGCRGAHLYRPAEHEAALAAQATYDSAAVAASAQGAHDVLARLLAADLATVRRQMAALRDAELVQVVGGTTRATSWDALAAASTARFEALVGQHGPAEAAIVLASDLPAQRAAVASDADLYRLVRRPADPEPRCPILPGAPEPVGIDVRAIYARFAAACRGSVDAQVRLSAFAPPRTVVGETNRLLMRTDSAASALGAEADAAARAAAVAESAYAAAVRRRDTNRIREAGEALRAALARLDTSGIVSTTTGASAAANGGGFADLALAGRVVALQQQHAAVVRVVDALLDSAAIGRGSATAQGGNPDLALLAWLPELDRSITATRTVAPAPLLLAAERLRLQFEATRRRQRNAEFRLELLRARRDAELAEARALLQASHALTRLDSADATDAPCRTGRALADDFRTGAPACRDRIVRVLMAYTNAWTLGRIPAAEADARLLAARHTAVVEASENALAQWDALVRVPLDQLVAFHASGVRSQDVAALLSALGVGVAGAAAATK